MMEEEMQECDSTTAVRLSPNIKSDFTSLDVSACNNHIKSIKSLHPAIVLNIFHSSDLLPSISGAD